MKKIIAITATVAVVLIAAIVIVALVFFKPSAPPATPQEYTVTFDYNYDSKGTYQTAQTVNGKVAAPAENPGRTDHDFGGWFTAPEGGNEWVFDRDQVTESTTLYAHWTAKGGAAEDVTVTFRTNGGSSVNSQTFKAGGKAIKPETDPTYGENVFCGWYSDEACTQEYDFNKPVNENITIYALWKHWADKESVAVGNIVTSAQSSIGSDGKLTTEYKYNDHITFPVGMKPETGNINTQGKSPITVTLADGGVYGIYIHGVGASSDKQSQIIIKDGDGETAETLASSEPVGSKAELSVTVQDLKGGTYYIYSTNSVRIDTFTIRELVPLDQSGNPGGEQGGGQELTTVTVTFESAGGTQISPVVLQKDKLPATIDEPDPAPSRFGFKFNGWFTEPEGGNEWVFDRDQVTESITLYAHWEKDPNVNTDATELYTVTFTVDGSVHYVQKVENGQRATRPADPKKDGAQFVGWYKADQTPFDFDSFITDNLTLTAKFENLDAKIVETGAYNESLYVIWQDANPAGAKVEYKLQGASDWTEVDAPLIRAYGSNARADIVGLKAGNYNVRVTPSGGVSAIELPGAIAVAAYDRSGYAHFNYHDGIGAYNDDGTLKEGTLVIYVTDENKNDILDYAYVNGQKVDISGYMVATQTAGGVTAGQQTGIGALLNNRRYSGADRMNVGIAKLCEVYGSVAIRIVGKVSAELENSMVSGIDGLTTWDSTENGGSEGDNGRMARMVNAHDLTIEGIGDDASIYGWGIHFISSVYSGKTARMGTSFEVRNITFEHNPEDAVGMEGEQESSGLTAPVERCWIHNNTFLPGYAYQYAGKESDKKEGDGSCDFKRGMYYTLSYNYFEYCHKTNLIGSSDDAYQFNITMHHNWWNNCGSRVPLARQANIHYYNNYVSADRNDSRAELSYVMSIRANAYIFAEANYFDGCKNVTQLKAGAVKGLNNVVYANEGDNEMTVVSDRSETVPNGCKYLTTDYSKFDTDENLFYYDKVNNVSRCLLDDAVTARQKAIMFAGANGHGKGINTAMNQYTPDGALQIPDGGNLTVTIGTDQQGIAFNGVSKGKFKGQGITFTLAAEAALTITTTTTGEPAPELISSDGRMYAHKFEDTLQIVLPAGTYIVASGQKDKEAVVTAMTFENTEASSAARVEAAKAAIEKLPEAAEVALSNAADIKAARTAYNSLTAAEKKTFDEKLLEKLEACEAQLSKLQVERVKELIGAIGEVTAESYPEIEAAQNAYNSLNATQQAQLTEEKATLDKAVADFEKFAVQSLIDDIDKWRAQVGEEDGTDRENVESLVAAGQNLQARYDGFGEDGSDRRPDITNYADLTEGMDILAKYQHVFAFEDALDAFDSTTVTAADSSKVAELKTAYEALTPEQQQALTSEQTQKYNAIIQAYTDLMSQSIAVSFLEGKPSNEIFEHVGEKKNAKGEKFFVHAANQEFASGAKFESTTDLKLTLTVDMELKLYFNVGQCQNIKIDGTLYTTAADGEDKYVVTVKLKAGEHHITRGDKEIWLYYATLTPAA